MRYERIEINAAIMGDTGDPLDACASRISIARAGQRIRRSRSSPNSTRRSRPMISGRAPLFRPISRGDVAALSAIWFFLTRA